MTVARRLFRYFALALASIQIVAFASAPAIEGALAVSKSEASVSADRGDSDRSAPRHDPSTCVVCQLLSVVASLPVPPTVAAPIGDTSAIERPAIDFPRQHILRRWALSRAPPALPA
jgi:hypothetical protein